MLFRLLTLGLCTTCVVLLLAQPPPRTEVVARPEPRAPRVAFAGALSVVDVAAVALPVLPRLVPLARDEWIEAINDRVVYDDRQAAALMWSLARPGGYLDLTVVGDGPARRVLVLIHAASTASVRPATAR